MHVINAYSFKHELSQSMQKDLFDKMKNPIPAKSSKLEAKASSKLMFQSGTFEPQENPIVHHTSLMLTVACKG